MFYEGMRELKYNSKEGTDPDKKVVLKPTAHNKLIFPSYGA